MKRHRLFWILLIMLSFCQGGFSQRSSKLNCELFGKITVKAAKTYVEKNDDLLSTFLAEALLDTSIRNGVEEYTKEGCRILIEYAEPLLEFTMEGVKETLEISYKALLQLADEQEDNIIRIYLDEN